MLKFVELDIAKSLNIEHLVKNILVTMLSKDGTYIKKYLMNVGKHHFSFQIGFQRATRSQFIEAFLDRLCVLLMASSQ